MSESVQENVFAWNADSAPWSTVEVTVTLSVSTTEELQEGEEGVDECAWLATQTQSGGGSKVFTFNREAPAFDDFVQGENKWALVRGLAKAAQGDDNGKGDTIKTVYTQLCTNGGPDGNLYLTNEEEHYTNTWSIVYAFNGTGDPGDCAPHENTGGSESYILGCNLNILQNNNQLEISGDVLFQLHEFYAGQYDGLDTETDSSFTSPVTIDVATFKAGGSVNFGSSQSAHFEDPGGYATFDINWTISFTCS